MAGAGVPLEEQQVTERGAEGGERTLPALVGLFLLNVGLRRAWLLAAPR